MPNSRWRRVHALAGLMAWAAARLGAQVTETPDTIAPGKFLVRMDAISLGFNRDTSASDKYTALGLASTVISTGLTSSFDVQVGFQLFLRETYQYHGARNTHSGLGDLAFRAKWTFWRDEGAGAAAAVIPYLKLPTSSGGVDGKAAEGGIIVPWSQTVAGGMKAGAMFEWDILRNDADNGYDSHWFASAFMQRDITQAIGIYGETTLSISSATASSFTGTLGGGATLTVSKNVQWDYGINRGLGGAATDWTHVLRLRWSF